MLVTIKITVGQFSLISHTLFTISDQFLILSNLNHPSTKFIDLHCSQCTSRDLKLIAPLQNSLTYLVPMFLPDLFFQWCQNKFQSITTFCPLCFDKDTTELDCQPLMSHILVSHPLLHHPKQLISLLLLELMSKMSNTRSIKFGWWKKDLFKILTK